jgi:hypothetical protein
MFTPAQAAPAGQLSVVVATCRESTAIWQDVPAGMKLDGGDYISGVVYLSIHGQEYPVEMYWQWRHTAANGNAIFQAIDWQTVALQSESIRIGRGILMVDGAPVQELEQVGTVFSMDCKHTYIPAVMR